MAFRVKIREIIPLLLNHGRSILRYVPPDYRPASGVVYLLSKAGVDRLEYEFLYENNAPIQPLSDAEIILNIQAGNEKNYFVFMLNHEDEEDGVMIGFGLNYHEDFSAYLHLPPKYLKELIEKYALVSKAINAENMTVEQYFGLVKLQGLVYCQLYIFLSEDKELLNPIGFGSGFFADYKGKPFLITADHVLHLDDYKDIEVRTGNEYIIAIVNNVNNLDSNISTVLTPLGGFYYAEKIEIKSTKEDLIDISVCLLKEINFEHPFLTHEISIQGNIIQPAGIEKQFYDTSQFAEPTNEQKYSIYGVVRNDIVGIKGVRTNALYSNISYNGVVGNYFVFEYPNKIIEDDWVGISGAPMFDYEGNIVGVGHRVLGNGIWVTPIKYAKILMELAISEYPTKNT